MSKIYIITGQTATGKTKYALDLASKENGELINCDSRQIYKHLDIITGKDLDLTDEHFHLYKKIGQSDIGYYQTKTTKIWLYDMVNPSQTFSSFDYRTCAIEVIKHILSQNKTPILVGGTYFYLKHLLYNMVEHKVAPNWELRHELEKKSTEKLQEQFKKINLKEFEKLNNSEKNNPQRLIRKIEIAIAPPQSKNVNDDFSSIFPDTTIKMIGLITPSKEVLKNRIRQRVEDRLQNGAIEEVKKLLSDGFTVSDPGLKTIGYSQLIHFIQNKMTLKEASQEWITKEIQYAKRQLTFMKKDPNIEWIEI